MLRAYFFLAALALTNCGRAADVTALVSAAREGRTDLIAQLVKQGANPNLRSGVNGWTPLEHAIHKNQKGSVIGLLDSGADVNARDHDGSTALMMAAGYGYADIVQVLLDRGADPHFESNDGSNALTLAVLGVPDMDRFTMGHCQVSTVRALLDKTPDLRFNGPSGPLRALTIAKVKSCPGLEKEMARRTR
ncbi:MAG: ankyrin repeat domain-containing protein [Acidobacteriia bacterium]|nr:ankyrin repeat domain-containing protein [Terriglobia bacterium]